MYIYTIRATSNTAARYIFKEFVIEFQVGEQRPTCIIWRFLCCRSVTRDSKACA